MFSPHRLENIPFGKDYWCEPVISLHKTHPFLYKDLWSWENERRSASEPPCSIVIYFSRFTATSLSARTGMQHSTQAFSCLIIPQYTRASMLAEPGVSNMTTVCNTPGMDGTAITRRLCILVMRNSQMAITTQKIGSMSVAGITRRYKPKALREPAKRSTLGETKHRKKVLNA